MIRTSDGEKLTPKEAAKEVIICGLAHLENWDLDYHLGDILESKNGDGDALLVTERERALIDAQLVKMIDRVRSLFNL